MIAIIVNILGIILVGEWLVMPFLMEFHLILMIQRLKKLKNATMESNMKNKKHFFGATSLNNGEEITHHYIDVYNEYFDEYLR